MLNGQYYVGDNNDDDDVDDNCNHVDDYDEVDANLEDGTWSAWRPMASISSCIAKESESELKISKNDQVKQKATLRAL